MRGPSSIHQAEQLLNTEDEELEQDLLQEQTGCGHRLPMPTDVRLWAGLDSDIGPSA